MSAGRRSRLTPGGRLLQLGLAAFAAYHLALAVLMAVAPEAFYEEIGPFGPRNDHYIRDVATYNLAIGAALLVAVRHSGWRLPVLALVLLQFALHSVNHLVDIGEAEPGWVGVADFVGLLVATGLLFGLIAAARRSEPGP